MIPDDECAPRRGVGHERTLLFTRRPPPAPRPPATPGRHRWLGGMVMFLLFLSAHPALAEQSGPLRSAGGTNRGVVDGTDITRDR
jgi:hypothetical protein